jgi:CHASE2 domain-containing sensor protein/signal transduction histidine kinase
MQYFAEIKKLIGLGRQPSRYEKKFVTEWYVTAAITALMLAFFVTWNVISSVGNIFYDQIQVAQKPRPNPDILIVTIDDQSIAQLGGWPLSRSHYANLLKQLADEENQPKKIGFDILFLDSTSADQALAEQMRRHQVILPVEFRYDEVSQHKQAVYPVNDLKAAAADFGHLEISYDHDGVIRGSHVSANQAPHFSVAISGKSQAWGYQRFNMVDPAQGYQAVSLYQALSKDFDRGVFKNKYVLIGATAASLGDRYPTIFSGKQDMGTPGVQINADLLSAILQGKLIDQAGNQAVFWFGMMGLLLVLLGLLILSPTGEIVLTAIVVITLLMLSYLLLRLHCLWINPLPAIVAIVLVKPVWAWRRMEMMSYFMQEKTQALAQENEQSTHASIQMQSQMAMNKSSKASFIQYIQMLSEAIQSANERLNFLALVIREIPEAVLITDESGLVMRHNQKMEAVFDPVYLKKGHYLELLFQKLNVFSAEKIDELLERPYSEERFAAHDQSGSLREFRMRVLPLPISPTSHWRLMMMVDITDLVNLQKQRDRTLAILTHDMRTPVASILAILRNEGKSEGLVTSQSLSINKHAHYLLKMMDDFILSIRAEAEQYRLEETLFETLLDEALYQIKELMQSRKMVIKTKQADEPAFVQVDSRLITRVIVNLLGNAIRYGQVESKVEVFVNNIIKNEQSCIELTIENIVGDGRHLAHDAPENQGFGMGLEFIQTVIKKHHGSFDQQISSVQGGIAKVIISLPSISI